MYQHPSIHFELARQRQEGFLDEARADQLASQVKTEPRGTRRRDGVGSIVTSMSRRLRHRPAPQPRLNPAS